MTEEQLKEELGRAYRCIVGLYNKIPQNEKKGAMFFYHSLTIAAAKRCVYKDQMDGAEYFVGKGVEELHNAMNLGEQP